MFHCLLNLHYYRPAVPEHVLQLSGTTPHAFYAFDPKRRQQRWPRAESNHRHKDFQSSALPTELLGPFF
jgi:hypothetical protein